MRDKVFVTGLYNGSAVHKISKDTRGEQQHMDVILTSPLLQDIVCIKTPSCMSDMWRQCNAHKRIHLSRAPITWPPISRY